MDFVEICNVCAQKAIIKAAKRIINSDKMCRSYSDLNFGVIFWNTVYFYDMRLTGFLWHRRNQIQHRQIAEKHDREVQLVADRCLMPLGRTATD